MKSKLRALLLLTIVILATVAFASTAHAQPGQDLEERVSRLERRIDDGAGTGMVLFLFGAVCALWAQNTGRSPWLWFFLGAFFSVVTVLVLLWKNSEDRARAGEP